MQKTRTMHISLPSSMKSFVEGVLEKDGYSTTSEYIKTLIRRDQNEREKEQLEIELVKAINSGELRELNDEVWNSIKMKVEARIKEKN